MPFVETVPGSSMTFTMRPVTISDTTTTSRVLWFAETETTWDAYDVFYLRLDEQAGGANVAAAGREGPDAITRPTLPYSPPDLGWGHGGYPAIGVTFHAAQKYCKWLTAKTGRRFRLPTVPEFRQALWETCGHSLPAPGEMHWFGDNAGERTHPVAKLKANGNGLYDIAGNVAEWCTRADGTPVVMGGSFAQRSDELADEDIWSGRPQSREWNANDPSLPKSKWWLREAPFVGFRVVCEEGPG